MANITYENYTQGLAPAGTQNGTELIPVVQSGSPVKMSLQAIVGNGRTAAEINAGVTPSNYAYLSGSPVYDVRRTGAVLDNVTDDFLALKNALSQASVFGGRVLIPGTMAVASSNAVSGVLFTVSSNVEIIGLGRTTSSITVTGTTVAHLFKSTNGNNIRIADLSIKGNSQSAAFNDAAMLYATSNNSAAAITGNIIVERCAISNFKSDYWIFIENTGSTFTVDDIFIHHNVFTALSGNSRGPALLTTAATCIALQGSTTNTTSLIRNVFVHDNFADCNQIKAFCWAYGGTLNVQGYHNVVLNAGQAGASDNSAAYAFMAYDNASSTGGSKPDLIKYDDNIITSPRSCGIYVAGGNRVSGHDNKISGQTDQVDATLPKAAISVNGAISAEFHNNQIDTSYGGIVLFQDVSNTYQAAHGNKIRGIVANGFGIQAYATFAGQAEELSLQGNRIDSPSNSSTFGIYLRYTSAKGINNLIVSGNSIRGCTQNIYIAGLDATVPHIIDGSICENKILGGASFGLYAATLTDTAMRLSICRNKFGSGGVGWGTAAVMLQIQNSVNLDVLQNEFCDMTSGTGAAISNSGAQGNLEGNRFTNVASANRYVTSAGFGTQLPTWATSLNGFVQDLNTTETGAVASKYTRQGWQYDATNAAWKEVRCLTGN